ncbi:unnamed protein product [Colias eurytheme]|nr:unnamed protein product [Colias eurytheme]
MSTICDTMSESHSIQPCEAQPVECLCKKKKSSNRMQLVFNAVGIMVAVLATYMIINTDSKLYIIFWICYSVLRRLMVKSRRHLKTD